MNALAGPALALDSGPGDRLTQSALVVDGQGWTYGELARLCAAHHPRLPHTGRPVALVAERNAEALHALYCCIHHGHPVLLLPPTAKPDRRRQLVERVGAESIFDGRLWHEREAQPSTPQPRPEDQFLVPTSGTTGEPKIVVLPRRAAAASADSVCRILNVTTSSRWALTLPYFHVGGLAVVCRCLHAGATVVVEDFDFTEPDALLALDRRRVTHVSLVPTQLKRALAHGLRPAHLEVALVGGAPCSPRLRKQARSREWPIVVTYGMTETGSQICAQEPGRRASSQPEVDVGRPIEGVEVALDGSGRIVIRGAPLMDRYWGKQPLADQWFVSGDCGYWDESDRLVILGRADNVIITGGENVPAERVEQSLALLASVEESVVFGLADEEWGQIVVALVRGKKTEPEVMRRLLADDLEPPAIPKEIHFVDLPLPRLENGKLDRRAARALLGRLREDEEDG